jgi:hypothetical protein
MTSTEFRQILSKVKDTQKALAHEIREGRKDGSRMRYESDQFRNNHLAYCLVRGRSLRQIEQKNGQGNEPYRTGILKAIKELFGQEVLDHCRPYVSGSDNRVRNDQDIHIPKPQREVQHEEAVHACA